MENLRRRLTSPSLPSLDLLAAHSSLEPNVLGAALTLVSSFYSDTAAQYQDHTPESNVNRRSLARRRITYPHPTKVADDGQGLIHIPRVVEKAYISRQVLLIQVASRLGLTIYSNNTTNECGSKLRAQIQMDVPPGGGELLATKRTFYSDVMDSAYGAAESAAEAAITCLVKVKNVQINDANYSRMALLEKRIEAAKSFEDAYTTSRQQTASYITSLKKCATDVLDQIQIICCENRNFLPLDISTYTESVKGSKHAVFRYTGSTPPVTAHEKLAVKLADLASTNNGAPSTMSRAEHI